MHRLFRLLMCAHLDGERAHVFKYQGVGLTQGMAGDEGDGVLEVTIPVKAGSRSVGASRTRITSSRRTRRSG